MPRNRLPQQHPKSAESGGKRSLPEQALGCVEADLRDADAQLRRVPRNPKRTLTSEIPAQLTTSQVVAV